MTDMKEAMRQAQAHATLVRRAERDCQKQIDAAIFRAHAARQRKIGESLKSLSPAAARIVVAAESDEAPRLGDGTLVCEANDVGKYIDPNPTPAWLNESPPPVPPGGVIEVADKPKARRA